MNTNEIVLSMIAFVISFGVTFFLIPEWIKYAKKLKIMGQDMHKVDKTKIPEAGGLIIVCAIIFALLLTVMCLRIYCF